MKDMITAIKGDKKNKELLVIKNVNKTVMIEVAKVSSTIDFSNKYGQAINNADMNATRDVELTDIKKYWRYIGQIQDKIDCLYKNKFLHLGHLFNTFEKCTIMKR